LLNEIVKFSISICSTSGWTAGYSLRSTLRNKYVKVIDDNLLIYYFIVVMVTGVRIFTCHFIVAMVTGVSIYLNLISLLPWLQESVNIFTCYFIVAMVTGRVLSPIGGKDLQNPARTRGEENEANDRAGWFHAPSQWGWGWGWGRSGGINRSTGS